MKSALIYLMLLLSFGINAQNKQNFNNSAYVEIDGSRRLGIDCSYTMGSYCEKSIKLISPDYSRKEKNTYGEFFIEKDTLKLRLEKNTISLNDILYLFKDRKISFDSDFHLSLDILQKLNLNDDFIIKQGLYNVKDSNDKHYLVIVFNSINPIQKETSKDFNNENEKLYENKEKTDFKNK